MLLAAVLADLALGRWLLGRPGQTFSGPTALAMQGIARIERRLNRPHRPPSDRRVRGVVVLVAITAAAAAAGAFLETVRGGGVMRLGHLLLLVALLEVGGPPAAARRQAETLAQGEHSAARAGVERLALRLADGAIGPMLIYLLFGLAGLAAWRAIVLLERGLAGHAPFDAASVAAYRLLLWPAGLLTGATLGIAALLLPGASPRGAFAAIGAAPGQASRAAFAGAFDWSLADGRGGWLGPRDGRARLGPDDLTRAAGLGTVASLVAAAGLLVLAAYCGSGAASLG